MRRLYLFLLIFFVLLILSFFAVAGEHSYLENDCREWLCIVGHDLRATLSFPFVSPYEKSGFQLSLLYPIILLANYLLYTFILYFIITRLARNFFF